MDRRDNGFQRQQSGCCYIHHGLQRREGVDLLLRRRDVGLQRRDGAHHHEREHRVGEGLPRKQAGGVRRQGVRLHLLHPQRIAHHQGPRHRSGCGPGQRILLDLGGRLQPLLGPGHRGPVRRRDHLLRRQDLRDGLLPRFGRVAGRMGLVHRLRHRGRRMEGQGDPVRGCRIQHVHAHGGGR